MEYGGRCLADGMWKGEEVCAYLGEGGVIKMRLVNKVIFSREKERGRKGEGGMLAVESTMCVGGWGAIIFVGRRHHQSALSRGRRGEGGHWRGYGLSATLMLTDQSYPCIAAPPPASLA
jgi:hypothetical protein